MFNIWSFSGAVAEYLSPDMVAAMVLSQACSIQHAEITTGVAAITGAHYSAVLVSLRRHSALPHIA